MINNLVLIVYILISILIIFFVLISYGKGSEIGVFNKISKDEFFKYKYSNNIVKNVIIVLFLFFLLFNFLIMYMNSDNYKKKINKYDVIINNVK